MKPITVSELMVSPTEGNNISAPAMAMGIPAATQIASLFSRSDAYHYLPESVDFFPSRHDICRKIIYSGFKRAEVYDLTFGISTIFLGFKVEK
jgi:ubiquinone/menaquinone biosynthesis C-methylase UbiE